MLVSYYLIGDNIHTHKINCKIQKLKQNTKKEVVWVMKDDSFINLIYFLAIENIYNDAFNSFKTNIECDSKNKTSINNSDNHNKLNDNNIIDKSNNLENKQGRITKKIVKRKCDQFVLNGGIINNEENIKINSNINNDKQNRKNQNEKQTDYKKMLNSKTINNKKILNNIEIKNILNAIKNQSQIIKSENNIKICPNNKKTKIMKNSDEIINVINSNDIQNKKTNIPLSQSDNKQRKELFNDKNNKNYLYFSSTPKKSNIGKNNLKDLSFQIENNNYANSIFNNSDKKDISSNRNDNLNISLNTLDTNDILQEDNNKEYKILSNNNTIYQGNIFSKKYISSLNPNNYEYDTFCHAIIKTGLSEEKISLSKYSEKFPAQCGHELCSKLPALEPKVLSYYQNIEKTNKLDIKQEATSHLVFPLGIKLCLEQNFYNENIGCEPLINTIYNEKGDLYYIASLTIFRKITLKNYNSIFSINPIDVYNKLKIEQKTNIQNKDINTINNSQNLTNINDINEPIKLQPNDIIYIPECISLVSRFPFFNQLSICLKTIINMRKQIVNGDNNQKIENDISNFINHLINQIPIASDKYNILFYTPINIEPVMLYNPFLYNFGNFTFQNIFSLLSIDNIITIFLAVLLEQKIIFVDINHLKLSAVTFFFINLIYPLSWVNTYQPLLSLSTIRYIQSITPFIMGGNENLILYAYYKKYIIYNESLNNIDRSNILFVSLTNNLISCDCENLIINKKGQNRKQILKYLNLPDLPKSIEKKLYNHLYEIERIEDLKTMNEKLKSFFCRIMVFILDDYKDYFINSVEKHIFNKDNYLMNKKYTKKLFYKELLGTQLFTQFIFNENEYYKMKKIQKKQTKIKNNTYGILHEENYKDNSLFMKNKNKIDELKIMIKQKRKERIKNSIKSAKKIVKNLGQLFYGTTDNKKSENDISLKKYSRKNVSSTFIKKKQKAKKYNIILMPYFIEEPNIILTDNEKYDYIQNKLNSIISIDNQLNQINNYKNKYIFDFNQKFELKSIKDDKTRYFIGILNQEEENKDNINKLNINIKTNNSSQSNGKNQIIINSKNKNNIETTKEENEYIKSKEKINSWFINICLSSNKRKISYELNIIDSLKNERNRKFFSRLLSQNYKTLFDIKENNQIFIYNEAFMELLQKIKFILSKINYDEYKVGKLLTLVCFKYYTYLDEYKNPKYYLYNKYTELFAPCDIWLNNIFWKTWFDEDISYIEKENDLSNDNDYSSELNKSNDEENELFEYNEENNNLSIEYRLLGKIMQVMANLKLGENFIKKIIFDDLALNYLAENELNFFREQYA